MPKTVDLIQAFLMLDTPGSLKNFLNDLCTPQELAVLTERWRVCQLLDQTKFSYREIHQQTGASLTTIGRVARFLKTESNQGYRALLDKIYKTL